MGGRRERATLLSLCILPFYYATLHFCVALMHFTGFEGPFAATFYAYAYRKRPYSLPLHLVLCHFEEYLQ
jgi:ABC-type Fe3+ transport system permease subunit